MTSHNPDSPPTQSFEIHDTTTFDVPGQHSVHTSVLLRVQADAYHLKLSIALLGYDSVLLDLSGEDMTGPRKLRGTVAAHGYQAVEDLIQDSLASIDVNTALRTQAMKFLRTYDLFTTEIRMRSPYIKPGFFDGPGGLAASVVFFQYRYPLVRFQWNIENAHYELRQLLVNPAVPHIVITRWKAWSAVGANPLVATGYISDTIIVTQDGHPVIKHRHFVRKT
ncbi:hypothetical protein C8R44DRAFT_975153 [Mycena epipterygia]|nr:hypothetical protein C8R44DRAFT_975153 [Mycena epipterygia]